MCKVWRRSAAKGAGRRALLGTYCLKEEPESKMANHPLSTIGCEMPPDFNVAAYEAVHSRVNANPSLNQDVWEHYAPAWNAVAYRFLSCAESDAAFTASITMNRFR